jgi:hypothetical protein
VSDPDVATDEPAVPADGPHAADPNATDPQDEAAARSAAALERYHRRMRRPRAGYAVSLVVLVVLAVVGVAVAWSNGEISHVTLHTVRFAPGDLPDAAP